MPERDDVINPLLLGISELGGRAFRNNSGVAFHKDGAVVRYGVASPGGSDILGWMPRRIVPADVGRQLAVFTAVEAKTGRQKPTQAQERFLQVVHEAGGFALWGNDPGLLLGRLSIMVQS